jgi:tetratricopeptide (TPR) repeat protein
LGRKEDLAKALFMLGVTALHQGEESAASSSLEECLLLLQELGEQSSPYYSTSLIHLGDVALDQGNFSRARSRYEQALALKREVGDGWGVAQTVNNLGEVARCEGDYVRAESLYNESMALFKEAGSPSDIIRSTHNLGYVAFHQDDYRRAGHLFKESLVLFREQLNTRGMAECLVGLAGVIASEEGTEPGLAALKAARLLAVAKAYFASISAAMWPADRLEYERNVASVRARLGEEAFNRAWEEGRTMNMEQAVEYALEEREAIKQSDV